MSLTDGARAAVDWTLEATVVGSFSRIGYRARRRLFGWDAEPPPDLTGRVVLVTGATSGLGLATAEALAALGAEVWIVGRDRARTEDVRASIGPKRVRTALADFARLDDVRELAALVRGSSARLDAVIHNAGALTHELQTTPDGLELTAQVHVVAPFLLTAELLPLLRETAGSRVITVSSGGMYTQRLDVDALASPPAPFNGVRAYANAKRAQVVLNERWSREEAARGVVFHAMHPGWADTPGVRSSLPRFRALMRPILRSPLEGADTMVWLAAGARPLETNGKLWLDRRTRLVAPIPGTHTDTATTERLWEWCVERAGARPMIGAAR